MNALKPSYFSPAPAPSPRRRQQRQVKRQPYRAIAVELSTRLVINVILITTSVSALVRLLPYTMSRQAKLQELQTEISHVEGRVDQLQASFNRHFDPQQAVSIMQEQSNRIDPRQRQIVWKTDPHRPQPNQ